MILNVAQEITWIEVNKKVWSDQVCKNVNMKFMQFEIIIFRWMMMIYNIVDQLQLQFLLMRFCCNIKHWCDLWLWGFQVLLVNKNNIFIVNIMKSNASQPNTITMISLNWTPRHLLILWTIDPHIIDFTSKLASSTICWKCAGAILSCKIMCGLIVHCFVTFTIACKIIRTNG